MPEALIDKEPMFVYLDFPNNETIAPSNYILAHTQWKEKK
jgi:hypothetical protein